MRSIWVVKRSPRASTCCGRRPSSLRPLMNHCACLGGHWASSISKLFSRRRINAVLIVGIEDLKGLRQMGLAPVRAQQTVREAVEGAHPHAAHRDTQQLFGAAAHLGGGLVGEGHRQHAVGRGALDADQPGDAVHQHAGLAAAGTGDHQHRPGRAGHRVALGIVKGVEQIGNIHGGHFNRCGGGAGDALSVRRRGLLGIIPLQSFEWQARMLGGCGGVTERCRSLPDTQLKRVLQ